MKPLSRLGIYLLTLIVPLAPLTEQKEENIVIDTKLANSVIVTPVAEQFVQEELLEEPTIMFGDITKEELILKLDRILKHNLSNKGEVFVEKAIEYEVDPYMAVAIVLHETGCNSGKCSGLVTSCNNVGGQKTSGTNKCGNGAYAKFADLDTGIERFFSNLARNYIQKGLETPEQINKKYAASTNWASKINYYISWLQNA